MGGGKPEIGRERGRLGGGTAAGVWPVCSVAEVSYAPFDVPFTVVAVPSYYGNVSNVDSRIPWVNLRALPEL